MFPNDQVTIACFEYLLKKATFTTAKIRYYILKIFTNITKVE